MRWQQFARDSGLVGHAWGYLDREIGRFQAAIGSDLTKTAPMIRSGVPQFVHLVDDVKNKLKDAIGRQRPFLSHRELKPCLPREYSELSQRSFHLVRHNKPSSCRSVAGTEREVAAGGSSGDGRPCDLRDALSKLEGSA